MMSRSRGIVRGGIGGWRMPFVRLGLNRVSFNTVGGVRNIGRRLEFSTGHKLFKKNTTAATSYSDRVEKFKMINQITLTDKERKLCELLREVTEFIGRKQPDKRPVVRFAGGWVRDKLLGLDSDDIDIAVDCMTGAQFYHHLIKYESTTGVRQTSHGAKIAANPEKSKHLETVAARMLDFDVDFVNLRSETYTGDSRVPTMEFGTPMEDALRRDITINSLFYNIHTEEVEDYCGKGLSDLAAGIIQTPMPASQTFRDDPLRILRCIRFSSRLGFEIQDDVIAAMQDPTIKEAFQTKISRERVGMELTKILKAPNPLIAFEAIHHCGLFNLIFMPHPPLPEDSQAQPPEVGIERARLMSSVLTSLQRGTSLPDDPIPTLPLETLLEHGFQHRVKDRGLLLFTSFLAPLQYIQYPKKYRTEHALVYLAKVTIKVNATIGQSMEIYYNLSEQLDQLLARDTSEWTRSLVGLFVHAAGKDLPEAILTWSVQQLHSNPDATHAMNQLRSLLDYIRHHQLQDAADLIPLIEGSQILKLLNLKPSRIISHLKREVLIWQLDHPTGTLAECQNWLQETYTDPTNLQRLAEQDR